MVCVSAEMPATSFGVRRALGVAVVVLVLAGVVVVDVVGVLVLVMNIVVDIVVDVVGVVEVPEGHNESVGRC